MSDELVNARQGPDGYWSPDLPPSRGQMATIATLALELLDTPVPSSRLDASVTITRLHNALAHPEAPEPKIAGGGRGDGWD